MHKIHRWGGRLVFAKLRSAAVDTDALRNLRAFRHQRVRWVSKARAYNNLRMQAGQLVSYLAFLAVLVLGVWAALDAEPLVTRVFIGALVVKIFAEACMLLPALSFLQQLRLSWLIVPVQPFYILYVLWVGVAGTLSSGYEWKGRRVH